MIEVFDADNKWVVGYVEVPSGDVPDAIQRLTRGDYVAKVVTPTPLNQMVSWVSNQEHKKAQCRREVSITDIDSLFTSSPLLGHPR